MQIGMATLRMRYKKQEDNLSRTNIVNNINGGIHDDIRVPPNSKRRLTMRKELERLYDATLKYDMSKKHVNISREVVAKSYIWIDEGN